MSPSEHRLILPGLSETLLHNGAACARIAAAAYSGDARRFSFWQQVHRFDNANAEGFIGWHDEFDIAFIAIAGTNDSLDALNDLSTNKVPLTIAGTDHTIQVHEGFLQYAEAAVNGIKLLRKLTHLTGRKKQLFITGHSLGGAAAELIPLLEEDFRPAQIHTFGAPRWCASEDALDYPFDAVHWRRPEDIVPDVPLHLGWFRCLKRVSGFSHVRGQTCWLTPDKADPETSHLLRRVQRIMRYSGASFRGLCASWRNGWLPVHTTLRIIKTLNEQAAKDHLVTVYHELADRHRLRRIGGRN